MDSDLLLEYAKKMEIPLERDKASLMTDYGDLVLIENEKINLTSITDEEDFIIKHILDSLLVASLDEVKNEVADVGTGGGFPGVIMKIYKPEISITLIDSVRKKLLAVERMSKELKINVKTVHDRAEELGKGELREYFDAVTARAVAPLNVLLEYCLPLVKVGGYFLAMKGKEAENEGIMSKGIKDILGGEIVRNLSFELPLKMKRNIVIYEKIKPTPKEYPRSMKQIKEGFK